MSINEDHKIGIRRDFARNQLENFYKHIEADRGRRMITRNWFITVWIAVLVAIGSKRLEVQETVRVFLVITPIIAFWLFETLTQTFIALNAERARKLERRLLEKVN